MRTLLLLIALLAPSAARAQTDAAEVLVERAVAAYRQGDLAKAGAFFLEAYELSLVPAQLRNAAKAYQDADDLDHAESLWARFAALEAIGPSERAEAEAQVGLIRERRKLIAAQAEARRAREEAATVRTATVTPTSASVKFQAPRRTLPVGPIITLAAAVAVGVAGAAVYAHADQRLRHLDDQLEIVDDGGLIVGIDRPSAQDQLDQINQERGIAVALGAIAGAAAIAGGVWWLLDPGSTAPLAAVTRGGATLGWVARW